MANGSFYQKWNFTDNPFSAMPLKADEVGHKLLVGREDQLRAVLFRLKAGGSAICLDGPVGVGKTSLANVAAYRAEIDCYNNASSEPLLIPCRTTFQISKEESPEDFRFRILTEVAQTLIEKAPAFKKGAHLANAGALAAWLNSPRIAQLEVQIAGFGLGGSAPPNESQGFLTSGFVKQVTQWLENIFPDDQTGASSV